MRQAGQLPLPQAVRSNADDCLWTDRRGSGRSESAIWWGVSSVAFVLVWFAIAPLVRAVVPAPDGGYPGFNTAEGQNALFNLTTGVGNRGVGWFSLWSDTDGSLQHRC